MPDIGRFFNIDPLAEKYVHNSTYAFAENKVITFIELEGLEGLHYMEAHGNGQRHVIEKNVIVLTQSPKAIPAGAGDKQVARINRQNSRIAQSNAAKVATVSSELNTSFNGSDGQANNSAGEVVRFQFNVTGMEVQNPSSLGTNSEARAIAMENGLTGGQPAFDGGPEQIVPAAIVTAQPTNQSSTNGITIKVDGTPGATAHEVGHTLMTRGQSGEESHPGSGGLMVDPPSTI